MEEWKDIEGYEGIYQVSNEGRVRSLNYHREGFCNYLKPSINRGYERVSLFNGDGCRVFLVHRLVAQAFIPNPDNLPIINHRDENPGNNKVSNLEWCDYRYNNTYNDRHVKCSVKISASRTGQRVSEATREKISGTLKGKPAWNKGLGSTWLRKPIIQIFDNGETKKWDYIRQCEEQGYSSGCISRCCTGKRKTYKGCKWQYINDMNTGVQS